ncbi:MAG: transglycosylase SLT domain-containing protein [Candidatus Eremiobacteraeota bacterium]|nr:transglycosylase SLT domain-containing protein [Candidatus Eremiobacteraeota bacterium]
MSTIDIASAAARNLSRAGVGYADQIAVAAGKYGLDPKLLAAVAAQETGGPGSNSGRNIVGDGGHGHGIFQIDDRWHGFAKTAGAMNPQQNANYAAKMISGLLTQNGGDIHKALSAYNAGSPNAQGTATKWADGKTLGYADSVMRHYSALGGSQAASSPPPTSNDDTSLLDQLIAEIGSATSQINQLSSFAQCAQPQSATQSTTPHTYRDLAGLDASGHSRDSTYNVASIIDPDDAADNTEGV